MRGRAAGWWAWALVLALASPATRAGQDGSEIDALVAAVGASDCEFQRNGRWHPAAAAQRHLQRKLDHARRLGREGSAEDFIEHVASRSSLTGRPYRVRCEDGREVPSAEWFQSELRRLRAADSSQSGG
jgi:hypothetical protein